MSALRRAALASTALALALAPMAAEAQSTTPQYLPGTISSDASIIYRAYVVPGVASSGVYNPQKSQIVSLFGAVQAGVNIGATGMVGFMTLAAMNANLNYAANTQATVYADSNSANNGTYLKVGASGAGSWTQASTLSLANVMTGAVPFTGDLTVNSLTVGQGLNPNGTNVALGRSVLAANNGGVQNAGFGNFALQFNTTGNANLAGGQWALQNNTTGANNTALGATALQTDKFGFQNVAVGWGALTCQNSIGTGGSAAFQNTAVGAGAMGGVGGGCSLVQTGNGNTALGAAALPSNTSGTGNLSLGSNMSLNTTGSNNVAAGQQALNSNVSGNQNVAAGFQPLFNNSAGANNIGMGTAALYNINTVNSGPLGPTGTGNIGIGQQTMYELGYISNINSNLTNGHSYAIYQAGSTNFVAIGAANNNPGTVFTYSGATGATGLGTGAVFPNIATSNNVVIGNNTGRSNYEGSGNTILGANINLAGFPALANAVILASGNTIRLDFGKTAAGWTASAAMTMTGAAIASAANQISYGGTTQTASPCPSGTIGGQTVLGCEIHNVAGVNHYVPYF